MRRAVLTIIESEDVVKTAIQDYVMKDDRQKLQCWFYKVAKRFEFFLFSICDLLEY